MNAFARLRSRLAALLAVAMATLAGGSVAGWAADDAASPIVAGREAFASSGNYPWYDAKTDSLQPIELRAQSEPVRWKAGPLLQWTAWIALAVLAATVLALVVYAIRMRDGGADEAPRPEALQVSDADRVEALPFLADRSRTDLLGQAREHYRQGNYSEAIIYLFSYELLQLDRFALVRLAIGKTNRQYLRETAKVQPLEEMLEATMIAFEDVFFGQRPLDRAGFEACWDRLPEFERLVARTTP